MTRIDATLDDGKTDNMPGRIEVDTDGLGQVLFSVDQYNEAGKFVTSVGVGLDRRNTLLLIEELTKNLRDMDSML